MAYARDWLASTVAVASTLLATSCWIIDDPNHCSFSGVPCGDSLVCDPCTPTNVAAFGCVEPGAVQDISPDDQVCNPGNVPDGSSTQTGPTTGPDFTTTTDADTTETEADETATTTTGPIPCMNDGDCPDGGTPFCSPDSGMCVTCTELSDPDGACEGDDPSRPLCREDACVQCTAREVDECTAAMPICDVGLGSCVPCNAHDQCDGGAGCNLFTGECLPAAAVVTVGPGGDQPSLALGLAALGGGDGTLIVNAQTYDELITISGGQVVAFVASGDPPSWTRTGGVGGPPQLNVDGATVLMEGIEVVNNGGSVNPGIVVQGSGRLWVDRGHIVANPGGAVEARETSQMVLRNSFLGGNEETDVVEVLGGSTATILYTTIGGGLTATPGNSTALVCDGTDVVTARNSIIVSQDSMPEIECSMLEATYTITEMEVPGDGNVTVGDVDTSWFMTYAAGDFHLAGAGITELDGDGLWMEGDPSVDIDGDARPTSEMPDYPGADVPP